MNSAGADPKYDVLAALYAFAPGVELTRDIETALTNQYAANGFTPLTSAQVLAITGPSPTYPKALPRFEDSNPDPIDDSARDNRPKFGVV